MPWPRRLGLSVTSMFLPGHMPHPGPTHTCPVLDPPTHAPPRTHPHMPRPGPAHTCPTPDPPTHAPLQTRPHMPHPGPAHTRPAPRPAHTRSLPSYTHSVLFHKVGSDDNPVVDGWRNRRTLLQVRVDTHTRTHTHTHALVTQKRKISSHTLDVSRLLPQKLSAPDTPTGTNGPQLLVWMFAQSRTLRFACSLTAAALSLSLVCCSYIARGRVFIIADLVNAILGALVSVTGKSLTLALLAARFANRCHNHIITSQSVLTQSL